jgi:glucokinase
VVIGGRLHLGLGHAGEIGHTTVDPDGPLCGCGNRGCLDRMASAQSIAAAAGRADVAEAAEAARAGDPVALAAFSQAGEYVGRVLAGAVVLLWPERVVVGGGVADAGELLLEPLRLELRRRACVAPEIPVVPAELGPVAGAVGAALWGAEVSLAA